MSKSRKARRRYVNKNRRPPVANVKPSALAEAKKRPWIMQTLLQRGPDSGGISAEQFEAGVEVVEGHQALTRCLGYRASALTDHPVALCAYADQAGMSGRDARLASIYLGWSADLLHRAGFAGHVVVEWVCDERPCGIGMVPFLVRALDMWTRHRDDWQPERLTDSVHPRDSIDFGRHPKPLGCRQSSTTR